MLECQAIWELACLRVGHVQSSVPYHMPKFTILPFLLVYFTLALCLHVYDSIVYHHALYLSVNLYYQCHYYLLHRRRLGSYFPFQFLFYAGYNTKTWYMAHTSLIRIQHP